MIDPFALPQVLVLPRDLDFAALRAAMAATGFAEIETGVQARPLIDDEPEFFAWAWPGGIPQVSYSFNPVARLRLLDVAEAPPRLREVLAQRLHPLRPSALRDLLQSGDDRDRLFAVYAARETERLDLIHDIGVVLEAARGTLRDEIEAVLHRLGDMAQARLDAIAGTRLVAGAAMDVIEKMQLEDQAAALLVRPADCAALFVPEIADQIAQALKAQPIPQRPVTAQPLSLQDVVAAPAGLFRDPNDIVHHFPMGYRQIAGWLLPSRVWVAWQGTQPDGGRVLMDGLAFTGTKWVFFPKPFRMVAPLLPSFPSPDAARAV